MAAALGKELNEQPFQFKSTWWSAQDADSCIDRKKQTCGKLQEYRGKPFYTRRTQKPMLLELKCERY